MEVENIRAYVLIYDGFAQFEVVLACYLLKTKGEVITVGMNKEVVGSFEGFISLPHMTIDELNIEEMDLLIIPGGNPDAVKETGKLYRFLRELNERDVVIGAICSSPVHLAKAGVLKGKRYTTSLPVNEFTEFETENYKDENVIVDHNIVTAKASGYVDFAIALGKEMEIYKDEDDLLETIRFFKYYNNEPG